MPDVPAAALPAARSLARVERTRSRRSTPRLDAKLHAEAVLETRAQQRAHMVALEEAQGRDANAGADAQPQPSAAPADAESAAGRRSSVFETRVEPFLHSIAASPTFASMSVTELGATLALLCVQQQLVSLLQQQLLQQLVSLLHSASSSV